EQLTVRSAPHLRSVAGLAGHIVGTRAGWFSRMMGEGDPDIVALAGWGRIGSADATSAAELVAGLESTWRMIESALERWTSADMQHVFNGVRNGKPYSIARSWVIWHLI